MSSHPNAKRKSETNVESIVDCPKKAKSSSAPSAFTTSSTTGDEFDHRWIDEHNAKQRVMVRDKVYRPHDPITLAKLHGDRQPLLTDDAAITKRLSLIYNRCNWGSPTVVLHHYLDETTRYMQHFHADANKNHLGAVCRIVTDVCRASETLRSIIARDVLPMLLEFFIRDFDNDRHYARLFAKMLGDLLEREDPGGDVPAAAAVDDGTKRVKDEAACDTNANATDWKTQASDDTLATPGFFDAIIAFSSAEHVDERPTSVKLAASIGDELQKRCSRQRQFIALHLATALRNVGVVKEEEKDVVESNESDEYSTGSYDDVDFYYDYCLLGLGS